MRPDSAYKGLIIGSILLRYCQGVARVLSGYCQGIPRELPGNWQGITSPSKCFHGKHSRKQNQHTQVSSGRMAQAVPHATRLVGQVNLVSFASLSLSLSLSYPGPK
jgi:hypothetical protein